MRRALDRSFVAATGLCALLSLELTTTLFVTLLARGGPAISWKFLTEPIRLVGADGGILHNIVGTLILSLTALAVSLPPATALALLHGVYLESSAARKRLWQALSILNGTPSILYGLFGFVFFVQYLGWGKSWLTGGVLLGMVMMPTIASTLLERIEALPRPYLEAAASLGMRTDQVVLSVILPQCAGGWITGAMLGLARVAGETAPIMFTATVFAGATFPTGIRESPVLSLPDHIFVLSQDSFDPLVASKVWGSALVLWCLGLGLGLAALPARLRLHEESRHA